MIRLHSSRSAANTLLFLECVVAAMPFPVQHIQTDRDLEFTAYKVQDRLLVPIMASLRPLVRKNQKSMNLPPHDVLVNHWQATFSTHSNVFETQLLNSRCGARAYIASHPNATADYELATLNKETAQDIEHLG